MFHLANCVWIITTRLRDKTKIMILFCIFMCNMPISFGYIMAMSFYAFMLMTPHFNNTKSDDQYSDICFKTAAID